MNKGILILKETNRFTEPFIHTDKLVQLGLLNIIGNGGSWRRTFEKKYRVTVVYINKTRPLHVNTSIHDELVFERICHLHTHLPNPSAGTMKGMYIWGEYEGSQSRSVPQWIRKTIPARCIICDTDKRIECDHINDDYTIPYDQLRPSDFQALCQHCNKKKREAYKKGTKYYKDIDDPGKAALKQLLEVPDDFVFTWVSPEELTGTTLFYRDPKRIRKLHYDHVVRSRCSNTDL